MTQHLHWPKKKPHLRDTTSTYTVPKKKPHLRDTTSTLTQKEAESPWHNIYTDPKISWFSVTQHLHCPKNKLNLRDCNIWSGCKCNGVCLCMPDSFMMNDVKCVLFFARFVLQYCWIIFYTVLIKGSLIKTINPSDQYCYILGAEKRRPLLISVSLLVVSVTII